MNYLKQIVAFEKLSEGLNMTANARSLYYALLAKNNELAWLEEFKVPNSIIQEKAKLYHRKQLDDARNRLVDLGFIEYKKGKPGKAGTYKIVNIQDDIQDDMQHNIQVDIQDNIQHNIQHCSTLNKLNKTKQNKNKNKKEIVKEKNKKEKRETALTVIKELDDDDDVINLLIEFTKMRQLKHKPLTAYAMKLRINELNKIAGDNKELKKQVINQTITSSWDRFYPLKEQSNSQIIRFNKNKGIQKTENRTASEYEGLLN